MFIAIFRVGLGKQHPDSNLGHLSNFCNKTAATCYMKVRKCVNAPIVKCP